MNRAQPKHSGGEKSLRREAMGLVLIGLSIILIVSIITYDPVDWPNSSRTFGAPTENLLGPVGALISFGFLWVFGYTSYALAALALIGAVILFMHRPFSRIVKPAVFLGVAGIFFPLLAALARHTFSQGTLSLDALSYQYGGVLGSGIAGLLATYLGTVGAYVFVVTSILVTVVLTTTIKISTLVENTLAALRARSERKPARRRKPVRYDGESGDTSYIPDADDGFAAGEDPFLTPVGDAGEGGESLHPVVEPDIVNPRAAVRKALDAPPFAVEERPGYSPAEYILPGPDLLDESPADAPVESREDMLEKAQRIVECLKYFNIDSEVRQITPGPIVTRYELTLAPGVKVGRVVNLSDDLAMALKSRGGIRILAPIPGKAAIGIEVPNKTRSMVCLRDVVESEVFAATEQPLVLAIGKSTSGEPVVADLEKMPHLLIAGSTGSGKSVCINALITSILMKAAPDRVKVIMVDPKVVELSIYNSIPHLLTPVITDPGRASDALKWAVREMERRYRLLASLGVRDINQYNRKIEGLSAAATTDAREETPEPLPFIVIIIDEFADLMVVASNEIEESIARLAQMARAVGMHLVLATQRPSADVITGLIKANFPSRIAFKVMQAANSRIILDQNGADKLLGMGDMLFLQVGKPEPVRLHGAFISNEESQRIVDFVAQQRSRREEITEQMFQPASEEEETMPGMRDPNSRDSLFWEAARLVVRHNQGSVSLLQRRLKVGYARAARLIDQLELAGIVSPYDGSKAREVMVDDKYLDDMEAEGL